MPSPSRTKRARAAREHDPALTPAPPAKLATAFPVEVFSMICELLPADAVVAVSRVCRSWRKIVGQSSPFRAKRVRATCGHQSEQTMAPPSKLATDFPVEIFSMIFGFLPVRAVITASHVCAFWRSLTLNDPGLWTSLTFTTVSRRRNPNSYALTTHWQSRIATGAPPAVSCHPRLLGTVLERSRNRPINVYASFPRVLRTNTIHSLRAVLLSHAPRIRHLRLLVHDRSALGIFPHFDAYAASPLSHLHTLQIDTTKEAWCRSISPQQRDGSIPTGTFSQLMLLPGGAYRFPSLLNAKTPRTTNWSGAPRGVFPHLRTLELEARSLEVVRKVLDACPALKTLHMQTPGIYFDDGGPESPVQDAVKQRLARVSSVSLSSVEFESACGLLLALNFGVELDYFRVDFAQRGFDQEAAQVFTDFKMSHFSHTTERGTHVLRAVDVRRVGCERIVTVPERQEDYAETWPTFYSWMKERFAGLPANAVHVDARFEHLLR